MRLCCFTLGFQLLTVQAVMKDVQGYHTDRVLRLLNQDNTVGPDSDGGPTEKTYQHIAEPRASQLPEWTVFDTGPARPDRRITKAVTPPNRHGPNPATSMTDNPSHVRIYTESQIQLISNYEKIIQSPPQAEFESIMNGSSEPKIHLSADATKASVWLHTLLDNSNQTNTDWVALTSFPAISASHPRVIDNLAAPVNDDDDKRSPGRNKKGISVLGEIENGQFMFPNNTVEGSARGNALTNSTLTCLGNRTEMSTEKSVSLAALSQNGSLRHTGTQWLVLAFNQFTSSLEEKSQTNQTGQNATDHTTANTSELSSYSSQRENHGASFLNKSQINSFPTETHAADSDSQPFAEMSVVASANTEKHNYIIQTFATHRLSRTTPLIYLLSKPLYTVRKPEKNAEQESSMVPHPKRTYLCKNNTNASHSFSINVKKDQALNFINNKWVVTKAKESEGLDHITSLHVTGTSRLIEAPGLVPFSSEGQRVKNSGSFSTDASTLIYTLSSRTPAKITPRKNGMELLGGNSVVAKPAIEDPIVDMNTTKSRLKPPFVDSRGAVNDRHEEKIVKSVASPLTESSKAFDFDVFTATPTTRNAFPERPTIRKLSASQSTTASFFDANRDSRAASPPVLSRHDGDAIKQSLIDGIKVGDRNGQAMMTEGRTTQKWPETENGKSKEEEIFTVMKRDLIINEEKAGEKIKNNTIILRGKDKSEENTGEQNEAVKQGKSPRVEIIDIIEGINKTHFRVNETSVETQHFTTKGAEDRRAETLSEEDIKNKVEIGKEDMTNVPPGPTTKSRELNRDKGHTAARLSSHYSLIKKLFAPEHTGIQLGKDAAKLITDKPFYNKVTRNHGTLHSTSPSSQVSDMTGPHIQMTHPDLKVEVSYKPLTYAKLKLTQTKAYLVNSSVSITSPPMVITAGLSSYQPQFTVNTSALHASIIHSTSDHGNKSDTAARESAEPTKAPFQSNVNDSITSHVFETVNISRAQIHRHISSDMTPSQPCLFNQSGKRMAHSESLHAPIDENEARSAHTLMLSMKAKDNQFPLNGTSQQLNLTLVQGDTVPSTYVTERLRENSAVEYESSQIPTAYSVMTNKSTENGGGETTIVHSNIATNQREKMPQNPTSIVIAQAISRSVYQANMADRVNSSTNKEMKNSNERNHGDEVSGDSLNKTNKTVTGDQMDPIFLSDNYKDINLTSMFAILTSHKKELPGNEDFVSVMNGFVIPALDKTDQPGISAFADSQPTVPANDVTNNAVSKTLAGQITGMVHGSFTPLPAGHALLMGDLRVHNTPLQQVSEHTHSMSSGFQITTSDMDDYVSQAGSATSKKSHIASTDESAASTSVRIVTEKSSGVAHGQHILQSSNHIEAFSVKQPPMTPTSSSKHTPAAQRNNSGGMETENVKQPLDEMSVKTIEQSLPAVHSMIAITRLVNNPDRGAPTAVLKNSAGAEGGYGTPPSLKTLLTTQAKQPRTLALPVHMPNQLVAVTNSSTSTEHSPTEMIKKSSCKAVGCAVSVQNTETIIGAGKIDGSATEEMFETQSGTGKDHSSGRQTLDIEGECENCSSLPGNTTPQSTTLLPVSQSDSGQTAAADTTGDAAKSVTKASSGDGDSTDLEGHRTLRSIEGAAQRHPHITEAQWSRATEMNVFKPAHSTEKNTKKAVKGQTLSGHSDIRSVKEEKTEPESEPKLLQLKPELRNRRQILPYLYLPGVSEVSDDVCGSGNYTAEMSVDLGRAVEPGDAIPALGNLRVVINLKTNNSRVNLQVTSCCLSPDVQANFSNSTCCLFSRLPAEPVGITLLPSALSTTASFTISLFRMINYSTAYLHCDLSVCLRNRSRCERQCLQQRNSYTLEGPDVVVTNLRNRISFGPMLKEVKNSTFPQEIDPAELDLILVMVSLVVGLSLVSVMLLVVWLASRRRSAWPLISPASPRACCVCPPRRDRDDLILP